MNEDQTFAIVGAGQAGGWAAKTLRDEGFGGRVLLIGDENYPPHERPPLSKEILLGDAEKETCFLWPPTVLNEANIEMRTGFHVTEIKPEAHTLMLTGGEHVVWDKLMIATGGRATTLPADGADLDGVFTLRTINDSEAIRANLNEHTTCLLYTSDAADEV